MKSLLIEKVQQQARALAEAVEQDWRAVPEAAATLRVALSDLEIVVREGARS